MNSLDEAIKKHITNAQRIVIKIGTNVIMRDDGTIALGRIYNLIEAVANLRKQNKEVLIVSSGAVGLGAQRLKLSQKPKQLILKQACAAIGQSRLMSVYEDAFEKLGVVTAQILLIEDDFTNRIRYINLRDTILKLLEMGVVPIINENDTVSTLELERTISAEQGKIPVFGDNDKLSALVMSKIFADMLIILSDVDGLYTSNPTKDKDATLIPVVPKITPEIEAIAEGAGLRGRGGMKTKIEAARIAINSGGLAVIVNGKALGILDRVLSGEAVGTVFLPVSHLSSKKRWIAFASTITGTVVTNSGAKSALLEKKASLLPAGVVYLEGNFERGEVVSITDESGLEYARGIVNYSSEEAKKLIGIHSDKIEYLVGQKNYDALVTRDNIVILS